MTDDSKRATQIEAIEEILRNPKIPSFRAAAVALWDAGYRNYPPAPATVGNLKIPAIGEYVRNMGTLMRIEDVTADPAQTFDYIIEQIEARVELRRRGEILKSLRTITDFYGPGEGVKEAIKEAKEYCLIHDIGKISELEVLVFRHDIQRRCRPLNHDNFYAPGYAEFSAIPIGCLRDLPDPIIKLVWSSKKNLKEDLDNEQTDPGV